MIGQRLLTPAAARQVKFVRPARLPSPDPLVSETARQVQREMRLVAPPFLAHTPAPRVFAACWMLLRETQLAAGVVDRVEKEAVAAAVSAATACPYCVEFHAIGVHGLGTSADADAIARDSTAEINDPRLRAVAAWGRTAHHRDEVAAQPPPYPAEAAPELIGVVVGFHYLARMVNVFLPDYLLPPGLRGAARRRIRARIAGLLRPVLRRDNPAGTSLSLLPDAELPAGAAWARGSAHIAAAVARAAAAFEAAGAATLSAPVRDLLMTRLAQWRGEDMGPTRAWLEPALAALPPADRPAGGLVLLAAFASHQTTAKDIEDFRGYDPADASLVAATAWASFTTAMRIGSWHNDAASRARSAGGAARV